MKVAHYNALFAPFAVVVILLGMLLANGCTMVISRDVLKEVDKGVTFAELVKDPTAHTGKVVMLGGVIVEALNKNEGTLLEVYQTRLDREGRPTQIDSSEGRFLALYKGFLDGAIYRKGREITIVGTVEGERVQPLGEMEYRYPCITIKEIHLWKEEQPHPYEPYPRDYYWDLWWWRPLWHSHHGPHRK